jgi:hypothetical protein
MTTKREEILLGAFHKATIETETKAICARQTKRQSSKHTLASVAGVAESAELRKATLAGAKALTAGRERTRAVAAVNFMII